MLEDKVLLSVAPVDAADKVNDPEKIAADVLECAKLGAGMVHLHVRKPDGSLTEDLAHFKKTVELIRAKSNIIIEASTGGVSNLTIQQRCAPLYYDAVETASLNVGSVNLGSAVYKNPIDEVKYCVSEIIKTGKTPEVEVFEIGMIHTTLELAKKFNFKAPLLFSLVLGHVGAMPATVEALVAMRSFVPNDMVWGITHAHRESNDILAAAVSLGARTMRIGFEDSHKIDERTIAETNAPIVAHTASLLKSLGKSPMTPDEGREFLNIGRA